MNEPKDTFWWRFANLNPAIYKGLIVAVFAVLASVGIAVSPDIPDQLIGLIVAITAMLQALWTRESVTPNAKVVSYLDDPSKPKAILPGEAVTTATDAAIIIAARDSG